MKITSYFKGAFATTYNIILNAFTLGRYVWLEGRVKDGIFQNWARRFRYQPSRFIQPTTEEEIVALVKNSQSLRLFGSGHSFNGGVLADDTLVSLDRYSGVIWKDPKKKQMAVKGGTRVRDLVREWLLPPNLPMTRRALRAYFPPTFTVPAGTGALSARPL
jgi:FAD/FMN-containing dehydrogenase